MATQPAEKRLSHKKLERNVTLLGFFSLIAVTIGGIVLLGVLRAVLRRWRARRASQHLTEGLMRAQPDTGVPVLNGVLAVERIEDAEARAGGSHDNKGEEAALAAIEMAHLMAQFS